MRTEQQPCQSEKHESHQAHLHYRFWPILAARGVTRVNFCRVCVASQSPHPITFYSVANYRSHLSHFLFTYLPYTEWGPSTRPLIWKTTTRCQYLKSVIFYSVGFLTPGSYELRKKYIYFILLAVANIDICMGGFRSVSRGSSRPFSYESL